MHFTASSQTPAASALSPLAAQFSMDFMNKAMTAVTDVVVGVQTATGTDDGFGFTQNADGVFVRQRVEL